MRGVAPFYYGSSETELGPFTVSDYDWAGNTLATAVYKEGTTITWSTVKTDEDFAASEESGRRALSKRQYDDLGRMFRSEAYAVSPGGMGNPAEGTAGDKLVTQTYYDRLSRVIAQSEEYGASVEYAYDGAGRQYQTRIVSELQGTLFSSGKFQHVDPEPELAIAGFSSGTNKVIEMEHLILDESGNVEEEHTFEVNHNATGLSFSSDNYVRASTFHWYDSADRVTTTAYYGSGDTASSGDGGWDYFSVPSPTTEPSGSDAKALVTKFDYTEDGGTSDDDGELNTIIDPRGIRRTIERDDLDRVIKLIEDDEDSGWGTNEIWILTEYDGIGNVAKRIADKGRDDTISGGVWSTDADSQVTTYGFADERYLDLVTTVTDPASDVIEYSYHLDGLLKDREDPNGTTLTFDYDNRRSLEKQHAATGTGVDKDIRSIKYDYDELARTSKVGSYPNTGATGTPSNEVAFEYDDLWRVSKSIQDHAGSTGAGDPEVVYDYDLLADGNDIFKNGARLKKVTSPAGRDTEYAFSSDGSVADRLHRAKEIKIDGTSRISYEYSGLGRLAEVEYSQPDTHLRYYHGTADGEYEGFDRFGRIVDQWWEAQGSGDPDVDRFLYDHNENSSITERHIDTSILTGGSKDEDYTYDNLDRLKTFDRGSGARLETFTLDALGNVTTYSINPSTPVLVQSPRSFADDNELTTITTLAGAVWKDPGYDANGNQTEGPKPGSEKTLEKYVYDAWNRLVKVQDSSGVLIYEYEYDGLGRRIRKTSKGGTDYDYYYNENWQVIEVRKDDDADPYKAYVWHPYYIDALAIRYLDESVNGASVVTHYYAHDAHMSVTAAIKTDGKVAERYEYQAYGEPRILKSSFGDDADGVSDILQEVLFSGYRWDEESGLYQVRHRAYHPTLGRWMQPDPIGAWGDPQAFGNAYGYGASSPVQYGDPYGLCALSFSLDWKAILLQAFKDWGGAAAEALLKKMSKKLGKKQAKKMAARSAGAVVPGVNVVMAVDTASDAIAAAVEVAYLRGQIRDAWKKAKWWTKAWKKIFETLEKRILKEAECLNNKPRCCNIAKAAIKDFAGKILGKKKHVDKSIPKWLDEIRKCCCKLGKDGKSSKHPNPPKTGGLKKQLGKHRKKLEEYKKDPDAFDNKGILKDAGPERRKRIIEGRIRHLETEIKGFEKQINDLESGGGGT